MWYARSAASRVSAAFLRCWPTLLVAAVLPAPYGLAAPPSISAFLWFLLSLFLAVCVVTALGMIVYMTAFHTISPRGVRLIVIGISDFCMGSIIPLPFFPEKVRYILELLPFSSMANVPLRIYSGDLCGGEMFRQIALQMFWAIMLTVWGKWMEHCELKRVVIQGG